MSTQETEVGVQTVSNDNLSVQVTKKPRCQIKFDITVAPAAVEAAYHKALKAINKEVNIPGFRKGKAPDQIVLERYGASVQKECVDIVLQTAFNEAIQLTHLHPLKDGNIKRPVVHECSREKGAHVVIEFEARPVIPTVQPEDLKLKKVQPNPITEEDRQNALQQVLLQFTTYEPIEDRGVQENDFVDLDVTVLENPPRQIIDNQRTQVNQAGLPSWMREKVIGLKAGESAEGQTEQNPDHPNPDFQSVPFRVTVKAVWQGQSPAVDDELAKKVGLQTIDELHQKIEERLKNEVQDEAYKQEVQELEQQLVEKYPFDLPQSYIDANKQSRLDDYLKQLESRNQEDYAQQNYEQIEKMIEQSTFHHLQLFFLLRKVAADNHVEVTNDEVSEELSRQIALLPSGRSQIDIYSDKQQLREQLYNLALDRKIKQFLLDKATWS
ncbi:trigger factor [Candidatus Protochlamydia phocaeensis]|uniref:trigger factor n=1 Tax=Candidatus Protochlamydia phocaeensis TaxID=1414722 RepID=UPI0008381BC4|nr:trigger factor [Candidatus Protochlamydia phocaeensis]